MKVSFVIVNYNRKDELLVTVASCMNLPEYNIKSYEIIVVDNASADGSVTAIKQQYSDVILIENKINMGVSAWNIGFARAKGDFLIVLDDDSQVECGLEKAIAYLEDHQDVGILALNITGGAFQTNHWKNLSPYAGFIGCGAIIRRELYEKIGGYADWIFLYTNEYEYGIRCMEAGYKIIYFADCRVIHRTSGLNRTSKRLVTFSVRNEMGIIYKYFNKERRNLILTRVFLNNLRCVFEHGIRSIPWYYAALKEFLQLKRSLQHTPVKAEVEKFYCADFWSTRRFLGIF